jgi:hypothetical protein
MDNRWVPSRRRLGLAFGIGLLSLALLALLPRTDRSTPVLGREWASSQEGYGTARPSKISNGGDPTGIVVDVTWDSWGGPRAIGQGISTYVAPNQTVAEGTQQPATVVAFHLGRCDGKPAYRAIEWYFPQHGGTFDPDHYIEICTGDYVDNRRPN